MQNETAGAVAGGSWGHCVGLPTISGDQPTHLQRRHSGAARALRGQNPESICSSMNGKMDYAPLLRRALWAIGFADVRFGILPPQSGFHRDEAAMAPE